MTDNTVLAALETHLINLCRAIGKHQEPFTMYRGDCANMRAGLKLYDEYFVPIYKAEREVVEAARYYFSNDHEQEWATRRMLEALQRLDKVRGTTPDS